MLAYETADRKRGLRHSEDSLMTLSGKPAKRSGARQLKLQDLLKRLLWAQKQTSTQQRSKQPN